MSEKITILGAGAWGTALAANQAWAGRDVTLWGRAANDIKAIKESGENSRYLPAIQLPENLNLETDITYACRQAKIILLATPAQTIAQTLESIKTAIPQDTILISCAKGIDQISGNTMSQTLAVHMQKNPIALLSGPSFAIDVAAGLPTAVTVAMADSDEALSLCETLSNKQLRCYASNDLIGVDYGGALKNVLAIAVGIAHGYGLGASACAALTTRGFAELQRIALTMGAKPETLNGLSGLGDLILSCASEKSRNFAYGAAIGRNENLSGMKLAEGAKTAQIAAKIISENKIDAPLVQTVNTVLNGQISIEKAMDQLLSRPVKPETNNK